MERTYREMVVDSVPAGKLNLEVLKRIKLMCGVEIFIVLAVTALHFAVVPGRVGPDEFMTDAQLFQCHLKERLFLCALRVEPVGELGAIVRLDTLNGIGELLRTVADKLC